MSWQGALPYFSESELACKGSGVVKLDLRFAAALPALRAAWERPMILTSVCRTPEHNERAGGHPRSLHLTDNPDHPTNGTMAADIAWREYADFPGAVAYPLQDVLNSLGYAYLNNTTAYALAYAIHLGVKHIKLYGMDFTYANNRGFAEAGRACIER